MGPFQPWLILLAAIVCEVFGTTALKLSAGLSHPLWGIAVVAGYGCAFWALSLTLEALPVGLTYAVWSGLGTAGAVLVGGWLFRETLGPAQWLGIALVLVGVVVMNVGRGAGAP